MFFQGHPGSKSGSAESEKVTGDQEGEVHPGNFKKALQTIAFIMNGSIDVGTTSNSDSEASNNSFNSETNSQVSTTVDSNAVCYSHSATINGDLDSETSEALKSYSGTSLDSEESSSLKSTTGDAYVNVHDEVTRL